jgi:hypothetical protein
MLYPADEPDKIPVAWYVVMDYFMAAVAWLCFYAVRSELLHDTGAYPISYQPGFISCLSFRRLLVLYALVGTYHSLYKKSRLAEFTLTLFAWLSAAVFCPVCLERPVPLCFPAYCFAS